MRPGLDGRRNNFGTLQFADQIESLLRRYFGLILEVFRMPGPVFEIFKDKAGKHRFHLKASNGEIIASSEAYETKQACKDGIDSVKKNAPIATVNDLST